MSWNEYLSVILHIESALVLCVLWAITASRESNKTETQFRDRKHKTLLEMWCECRHTQIRQDCEMKQPLLYHGRTQLMDVYSSFLCHLVNIAIAKCTEERWVLHGLEWIIDGFTVKEELRLVFNLTLRALNRSVHSSRLISESNLLSESLVGTWGHESNSLKKTGFMVYEESLSGWASH